MIADAFNVLHKIIGSGFHNVFIESFNKLGYVAQITSISGFYFMIYYLVAGMFTIFLHYKLKKLSMQGIQNNSIQHNNLQMIQY